MHKVVGDAQPPALGLKVQAVLGSQGPPGAAISLGLWGGAPKVPSSKPRLVSVGLDGGLPVVPQPCVGPQQLLDGHPGVSRPHGGSVHRRLHHQAGKQSQEACSKETLEKKDGNFTTI